MLNVDDSRVKKIRRKNAIDYVEISSGWWRHSAYRRGRERTQECVRVRAGVGEE
jgi:hypothetical protein